MIFCQDSPNFLPEALMTVLRKENGFQGVSVTRLK